MRRALLRLLLALALLAAALGGAGWWALTTEAGLRNTLALAQRFSGGALQVGPVRGRLCGEFVLERFHLALADGTTIEARRLQLRLRLQELPQGWLHLLRGRADALHLRLAPPRAAPSGSAHLPTALPLNLLLDSLDLDDFRIDQALRGGADENILALPQARLAARWIAERIEVARLDTQLAATGPLRISARLRMAPRSIEFGALHIAGPGAVQAQGTLGLIGGAASDLRLQWRGLQWPLTGAGPLDRLSGEGRVQGRFADYRFELHTAGRSRQVDLNLDAAGGGSLQGLRFERLRLASAHGALQGQGRLDWSPRFSADLSGQLAGLDPGVFAPQWSGVLNGGFRAQTQQGPGGLGTDFVLDLQNSRLRGHPLALAAAGRTDYHGVQLSRFRLQSGGGSLEGSGSVAWSPALRADLRAQLRQLDPAQFLPGWSGQLNGTIQAATSQRAGAAVIAFGAQLDRSRLRGYPVQLSARGELRGGRDLYLQTFALSSGDTRLTAAGQATPPFALTGQLRSTELTALHPDLAGRGGLDFSLGGSLTELHLVAKGQFSGLRYGKYHAAAVSLDADLDPRQPSHLDLAVDQAWAGLDVHSLRLGARGTLAYQHIELAADSERGRAGIAFNGGYDRARREWGGELSALSLAPLRLPAWALEKPAGLLLGARRNSLEPACLSGASGRACLRLEQNVSRAGLRLSWQLDHLRLASLQPVLPPHDSLQGEAVGAGNIEIVNGDVAAMDGSLRLQDVQAQVGDAPPLVLLPSSLSASDDHNRLQLKLDLRAPQGHVNADLAAAPGTDFKSRPLSGQLQVDIPDLSFVSLLEPELQHVGGTIGGTMQLGGSLGLPRIDGQLALADGRAHLVTPAIDVEQAQLSFTGQGDGPLRVAGSLRSGGGGLSIDGSLDPSVAPPAADLHLTGDSFQAMATPDAHVWITPDLQLQAAGGDIRVDGTFTVPKAQITPHGFADNGVTVSRDQVIVGAGPPPPQGPPLRIFSTVQVRLGDAVNFAGFGLTARMGGAVTLIEQPQQPTLAQGELSVAEGHYKAYGQDLKIESGRLIFDGGPVTEPAVDVYATRRPQSDVTVGVRVRGRLAKPELVLDSDPPMAREQQLSWLLLGHSLDQTSSSESSMVSQAALSLGLSGSDYLAQRLGKGIGLDKVTIGMAPAFGSDVTANAAAIQGSQAAQMGPSSPATQAAQLTLGKYLTSRLFVSYGVSLFQPGQTFRMLYDLGSGFKLQSESGVASGGDVLYTVERGR